MKDQLKIAQNNILKIQQSTHNAIKNTLNNIQNLQMLKNKSIKLLTNSKTLRKKTFEFTPTKSLLIFLIYIIIIISLKSLIFFLDFSFIKLIPQSNVIIKL